MPNSAVVILNQSAIRYFLYPFVPGALAKNLYRRRLRFFNARWSQIGLFSRFYANTGTCGWWEGAVWVDELGVPGRFLLKVYSEC